KVVLLVSPSGSATVTVMFAVPDWLRAGTMLTVRLAPEPPNVTEGTSAVLPDRPLRMRLAAGVSGSLMVKLMLVATSSPIVRSPIGEIVGGSLIWRMVSWNESLLVAVPSVANTVMVTVPTWLVAGMTLTVRLAPEPPKVMLASGTIVGLDERPNTDRLA